MKVKTSFVGVLSASLLLAALAAGCGLSSTSHGTSREIYLGTSVGNPSPPPAAPRVLGAVCSVLARCSGHIATSDCVTNVNALDGIGQKLGLAPGQYDPFANLALSEQLGVISANDPVVAGCSAAIADLVCVDPRVLNAVATGDVRSFAGVLGMIPADPGICNNVFGTLRIGPEIAGLNVGATQAFTGSGGVPPYVFSVITGTGTIASATGAYRAPGRSSLEVVRVTDAQGHTADSTFTVGANSAFTWTGAMDSNWSTPGNWKGGRVPGPADLAIFDGSCHAPCAPVIDASIDVGGVEFANGFSGTLTQGSGASIKVENLGWVQAGGAFIGADAPISIYNGGLILEGGNFASTRGLLSLQGNLGVALFVPFRVTKDAVFQSAGGTVALGTGTSSDPSVTLDLNGATLANLTLNLGGNGNTVNVIGSLGVSGDLILHDFDTSINGGTIQAYGSVSNTGASPGPHSGGTATIALSGSHGQTLSGVPGNFFPSLTLAGQGGETITLLGTIDVYSNWTYLSGNVDAGSSLVEFGTATTGDAAQAISAASMVFNRLTLQNGAVGITIMGDLRVGGDLNVALFPDSGHYLRGNTAFVAGNLRVSSFPAGAVLGFAMIGPGANDYVNAMNGAMPAGNFVVDKTEGGSVTLRSPLVLGAGRSATVISGSLLLNANPLKLPSGAFAVQNGGALNCQGGCGAGTACNQGPGLQCASFLNLGVVNP